MKRLISMGLTGLLTLTLFFPGLAAASSSEEDTAISADVISSESVLLPDPTEEPEEDTHEPSTPSSLEEETQKEDMPEQPSSQNAPGDSDPSVLPEPESKPESDETATEDVEPDAQEDMDPPDPPELVQTILSNEYADLLATVQASNVMRYWGMTYSESCSELAASFPLSDYSGDTEDESYFMLWEALNTEIENLVSGGYDSAYCTFEDGALNLWK